ncbi:nanoRNase/pAp phosphatase, hydrolyzes c-di-AMP and oligoRNAs [Haloplanus vescus]|uniref:NanoRNase/pAp phosphatase, hydrolyzes c-di-AMP and oligoRNAs n=1 Tax=Haloplanus vescus TaxID=555874 RepID=A0A1H3WQH9_9EURY|nr:DHH family phosphoesterase [Haloplanus vescus]SDZ88438.1 nanoRNase/pAp phosphatase, hydrolyzes c-di-AMP and oligoRNAs [Haloplanus vescus]
MSVAADDVVRRAVAFAQSHPELLAALLVTLVVLVGGGYVMHRLSRPRGVRFAAMLAEYDDVSVLTHPNPDPDAMAAAMGVASLAEQVGTAATIQFSGQIRHQENRAFRNVLEAELNPIERAEDLTSQTVVLVDHNEPRGFAGSETVRPVAVVDHHPGEGRGEAFTDVRTSYGACSSVIAEYFDDLDATPVPPENHESEIDSTYVVPSRVATGLFFGILTDTNRLTSGIHAADFDASRFLSPGVDESLLDRIANPQVSAETLEIKATAIREREVEGAFAISNVGAVSNVDAIPQAVDELILLEGVTAAIVYGTRDGMLYLSGRSRDDRVHMGRAIESALSDVPNASGGGHARMGGGQVPIDDDDFVWPARKTTLTDRLWRALEGDL